MEEEKGTLSIHSENIFPIIKKFLYSDSEIFLRELVSNAVDATQKIQNLAKLGEYEGELGTPEVRISVDKDNKTITVRDKGVGMTAEEVKKYINQIAFSGATEFIQKYQDKIDDKNQMIGHFGLGFYSAFMVADEVQINTLSYQDNAQPVKWTCDGSTEFEITEGDKQERGTDIILKINQDGEEFLDESRLQQILNKYCKFLPVPVICGTTSEYVYDEEGNVEKDEDGNEKTITKDNVINNTEPLWARNPNELKDEDYLNFYKELFPFSEEPLFWIHLNVDYPFNLTGILYFPKIRNDFDQHKNKIYLYQRQVFITDEVKDVVPEFLTLLHGVVDSPDIPLNVSRSYLQSDSNVKKINAHITKKVAEKLQKLYKDDRKKFEEKWDHIGLFVKYGMVTDDKFYDKAKEFALLKNVDGSYFTIDEYNEHIKANQTDKNDGLVWLYTTDKDKQNSYIQSAKNKGYDVIDFDSPIDPHFVTALERKLENTNIKRVDAESIDVIIDKGEEIENRLSEDEQNKVKEIFENVINDQRMTVNVKAMDTQELPVTITMPEFMRRMKEMQGAGGMGMMMGNMPDNYNVTINANHPLVHKILKTGDEESGKKYARQAYDIGLLSQNMLNGNELTSFINRSIDMVSEEPTEANS